MPKGYVYQDQLHRRDSLNTKGRIRQYIFAFAALKTARVGNQKALQEFTQYCILVIQVIGFS